MDCFSGDRDELVVQSIPQLLTRTDCFYPPLARTAAIEGVVGVRFSIDSDGRVVDAHVERPSGSNAGFEQVSVESGKENRWIPAYSQRGPVPHWGYYETVFICLWASPDTEGVDPAKHRVEERIKGGFSDSIMEIQEVYDVPPRIQKTEVVEYSGLESPKDDTGSVWVRAVIDDSGAVRYAVIVQSSLANRRLRDALVKTFYSYHFKPATSKGRAVTSQTELQIIFAPRPEVVQCH